MVLLIGEKSCRCIRRHLSADCDLMIRLLFISMRGAEKDCACAVIFIFNSTNRGDLGFGERVVDTQPSKVFFSPPFGLPIANEIENDNSADERDDAKDCENNGLLPTKAG
ncbi:MAG: hypothetical protein BGO12_15515 [Verrucomicrobia bacterium 61-8]|nr:MAG: hypothetical protein BGO12_15515 [Verrucomicrobia bacterium 61-8]